MSSQTPTVLRQILQSTAEQLEHRKREVSPQQLQEHARRAAGARAEQPPRSLRGALEQPGIGVIAEFKRRSPSAGELRAGADVREIVAAYDHGGARALSVLTEEPSFGGSLDDLRAARQTSDLPILRKDFIVDLYQLDEAVLAGADAVLLIVAALDDESLAQLQTGARERSLEVLVEVHDHRELERALRLHPQMIGINNRDLHDFSVDVKRTSTLIGELSREMTVVSESGIASADQLAELQSEGVAAVLVGESLMRSDDPRAALEALTHRARLGGHGLDSRPARI